jgi:hypothetical protein
MLIFLIIEDCYIQKIRKIENMSITKRERVVKGLEN